jgi:hypothetical protein
MDQLKVVLEHRFWILSGLAVLLPPIAWMVSTGDMAAKIETRTKEIQTKVKTLESVEKAAPTTPNKDWSAGASAINKQLTSKVEQTQKVLYEHQTPAMTWLPLIRRDLDEAKVKFRGEPANPQAFLQARRHFITRYIDMWLPDVYKVIEPFDLTTGEGKVLAVDASGHYTIMRAPFEEWQRKQGVTADELWGAQEDLWMMHSLMKAIAHVNEGASSIDNALIRRIMLATLRGGSPADLNERRTKKKNGPQTPGAPGAPGASGQESPISGWGGGARMGGMRNEGGPKPLAMIDPDDIFGSGEEASSGAQASGSMKKPGPGSSMGEMGVQHPYVEEVSNRWRSRGFVLRVVMDHQAIPKLLTALTESPFPVQIWHVELVPYDGQKGRIQVSAATESDLDQKRQKEIDERLAMALNRSNLAEVLIAGTFILYNESGTAAQQPAPAGAAPGAAPTAGAPTGAPSAKGTAAAPAPIAAPPSAKPAGATSKSPSAPSPANGSAPKAGPATPQPSTPAPTKSPGTPPTTKAGPAAKS